MGKTYTVTVPADAVRDKDGNPNSQYSFSFSTPFTVTATSPVNNATMVPVDQTITVTLSGNGVQGSAFSNITLKAGATTIQSAISINANVLTIDPATNLNNDTTYTVTIPADSIRNCGRGVNKRIQLQLQDAGHRAARDNRQHSRKRRDQRSRGHDRHREPYRRYVQLGPTSAPSPLKTQPAIR